MTSMHRVVAALAATALAVGSVLLGARPAAAEEGLTVAAVSRYVYDADDEVFRATMTMDLRNVSPDREQDGGIFSYYYDAYAVPVPTSSERVRARTGDTDLEVSVTETDDPSTSLARISFPELTYGTSRRIVLTFDITGEAPRSRDQTRLGPGYATFVAYGPGDEGSNRVEVVIPRGLAFTSTTDGYDDGVDGSDRTVTYTATENTFEGGLWSVVSVRDTSLTSERVVDVGELSLVLEAFPDDETWSDFVADRLTVGLPVLEELVDNPWPGGLQRIREDAAPSLRGYDGWFDPSGDEIVVGEQLDEDLIYHELSHAWLSGERFDQRWLYEGLAQVVAERTVSRVQGRPADQAQVDRTDDGAVALNAWDGDAGARSADVDGYAYPASYRVMATLLGDLDDEAFASVVGAGIRGERAYDPPGTVTPSAGRTSWSDWLDLVETRTGVSAEDVYSTWVLTREQRELLAPRAEERAGYAEIDEADGAWLPPEGLRDALTSWDFDRAAAVRASVAPLGEGVRAVQDASERTGLAVPDLVRAAYERASVEDDYAALGGSLPAAARAISSVDTALDTAREDGDPFTDLGSALLRVDERADEALVLLDDGEIATAQAAADDVVQRAGWAVWLGIGVVLVALMFLVASAALVLGAIRGRPAPRVTPGDEVADGPDRAASRSGVSADDDGPAREAGATRAAETDPPRPGRHARR